MPEVCEKRDAKKVERAEGAVCSRWRISPISVAGKKPNCTLEWLWEPYIAARQMNTWCGVPKAGKTTVLAHVLAAMCRGEQEFAGHRLVPTSTLIVTQEPPATWEDRRVRLSLNDRVVKVLESVDGSPDVLFPPIQWTDWSELSEYIAARVKAEGIGLVVFDLISTYWPVTDENDATQVKRAMRHLSPILQAGAGVLGLFHTPKDGRKTSRGSNALEGESDVFIVMQEMEGKRRRFTRRNRIGTAELAGMGSEVLELTPQGYVLRGESGQSEEQHQAQPDETDRKIIKLLPQFPEGATVSDVQPSLRIHHRNVLVRLQRGAVRGWWRQAGGKVGPGGQIKVVKGSPLRFLPNPSDS
jgi:hypothetical protein